MTQPVPKLPVLIEEIAYQGGVTVEVERVPVPGREPRVTFATVRRDGKALHAVAGHRALWVAGAYALGYLAGLDAQAQAQS